MYLRKIMNMHIKTSVATAIILVIVLLSSSYALFKKVVTDTNTQSITTGDLIIAFSNNNGNNLTDSDAVDIDMDPMSDTDGMDDSTGNLYAIAVQNTGTVPYCYTLALVDNPDYLTGGTLYNANRTLLPHNYIRYSLDRESPSFLSDMTNGIIKTYTINPGESIAYRLKIWVADADEYNLPDSVFGNEVHLNMVIDGKACRERAPEHWNDAPAGSLLAGIKANYPTADIASTKTIPGVEVATANEGLRTAVDDYGYSYYFRGAIDNNFVSFANMCWRIVRIDGLGNIKLVLYNYNPNSVSNPCAASEDMSDAAFARYDSSTDGLAGRSEFNSSYNKNAYIGFMYGVPGSSTYDAEHANTSKSTILTNLETWYNNNLNSYESKLADVIWCNDKSLNTDSQFNPGKWTGTINTGVNNTKTYYGPSTRIYKDKATSWTGTTTYKATLVCPDSSGSNKNLSRFTVDDTTNGNGALNKKIGLLTIDEVVFAGASDQTSITYYLRKNASSDCWWTMSPRLVDSSNATVMIVCGGIVGGAVDDIDNSIRPAISLVSTSTISGGVGTQDNPFIIN